MDIGLLILRLALGALLVGHGTQKLFGWFGGHGLDGTGGFFDSIGHRPGKPMAALAGLSEATGALLLALGLFTPLGAAIVIGVMLVAASTHLANGLWVTNGGYELPLFYAVAGAAIGFTGSGDLSLDATFGWDLSPFGWGLAAVVIGVLAAAGAFARQRSVMRAQPQQDAYPTDKTAAATRTDVTA